MSKLTLKINILQKLPNNWAVASLEDISDVISGQSPPSSTYNQKKDGLPFFQGKGDFGDLYPTARFWCNAPDRTAEKGDILISVRAPVGPTNMSVEKCCIGRGLAAIHAYKGINSKFVLYQIRSIEELIAGKGSGTNFNSITGPNLRAIQLRIAPTVEQKRIVEKIDEILSLIDVDRKLLEVVSVQSKQYKRSLILHAITGSLSKEFRNSNKINGIDKKTENELIQRFSNHNKKTLPKLDISKMPKIPDGWKWINFPLLVKKIKRGPSMKCNTAGKGIRYITSGNILEGNLRLDLDNKFLTGFDDVQRCQLKEGDLLLNCVNSLALIGKSAVVKNLKENAIIGFNNYAIELWDDFVLPEYANIYFQSNIAKNLIYYLIKRAVNQVSFATRELDYISFPLPHILEQVEIVKQCEERISFLQNLQTESSINYNQLRILERSTLKQAFEGKLVSQDPSDEPAEVLLKRIKQEKEKLRDMQKLNKANAFKSKRVKNVQ